ARAPQARTGIVEPGLWRDANHDDVTTWWSGPLRSHIAVVRRCGTRCCCERRDPWVSKGRVSNRTEGRPGRRRLAEQVGDGGDARLDGALAGQPEADHEL